jgi:sulfate adenylyltransferase
MTEWVLPEGVLRDAPTYTPRPHELADLELLLSGAYAPLTGFAVAADVDQVTRRGRLADGTPWPVPVTLEVPAEVVERLDPATAVRRILVLTDPEGAPAAAVEAVETTPVQRESSAANPAAEGRPRTPVGWFRIGGPVRRIGTPGHGAFRRLRRSPEEVRDDLPPGRVLGIIVTRPLHRPQLAQIANAARSIAGHILIFVPVAGPTPEGLPPESLVRSVLAARERIPPCTVVAVPLAPRGDEVRDGLLRARVASNYGVTHLLSTGVAVGGGVRVVVARDLAYDTRDGQWRPMDDIPPRHRRTAMSVGEINDLLDRGAPLPEWHTPPAVARELRRARPPRHHRGLVVLFTGLSGAGKSTIARGVHDALAEAGERTGTLLDGDVVRRMLSAGLGFSAEDRERNVRRIGFVAAEVARHGGVALCAPIAPYARSRAEVRQMVADVGADFVLVHVATPLDVCEQRDRKGLYAKARAGEVPAFTGVSDPYEEPTDADLVLDTSDLTIDDAVAAVLEHLTAGGWLESHGFGDSLLAADA